MDTERFRLDSETIQAMTAGLDPRRAPKRTRVHAYWTQEHEALCSLKGLQWPICVENTEEQCFDGFKEREAEQVACALWRRQRALLVGRSSYPGGEEQREAAQCRAHASIPDSAEPAGCNALDGGVVPSMMLGAVCWVHAHRTTPLANVPMPR